MKKITIKINSSGCFDLIVRSGFLGIKKEVYLNRKFIDVITLAYTALTGKESSISPMEKIGNTIKWLVQIEEPTSAE